MIKVAVLPFSRLPSLTRAYIAFDLLFATASARPRSPGPAVLQACYEQSPRMHHHRCFKSRSLRLIGGFQCLRVAPSLVLLAPGKIAVGDLLEYRVLRRLL